MENESDLLLMQSTIDEDMPFEPNSAASTDSGIFGLPYTAEESQVIFIPVPWEVTTSYGGGASLGPEAILSASRQVDLYDPEVLKPYEVGLHCLPISSQILEWNRRGKTEAQKARPNLHEVNSLSERLNQWVYAETKKWLSMNKRVAVVGGDHSVPFGAIQALSESVPSFGVLHLDAHSDTRVAYEGFTWSHASIFYNVLEKIPAVKKLVQVGIRDFCEEEWEYCSKSSRVRIFTDRELKQRRYRGESFVSVASQMVEQLPSEVWVSFDIDALDPAYCPHTGTPVPGGLDFSEAVFLVETLVRSGRKIIGFDLSEVAPGNSGEWDANVGARLLYKLTGWMLVSQRKRQPRDHHLNTR